MAETLLAMLNGHVMGRIERDRRGRLSFRYDADWLAQGVGLPFSFSKKLATASSRSSSGACCVTCSELAAS